jgi:endoglucanase
MLRPASLVSLILLLAACKMAVTPVSPSWDTTPVIPGVAAARTPAAVVAAMVPGWNLGNTLEGIDTEGAWGNTAQASTFDDLVAAGFQSVRIPVYFGGSHMGPAPDYTIATAWLNRVIAVVDMARARNLTVIVDMHHYWKLCAGFAAAPETTITRVVTLWKQAAIALRAQDDHVLFEVMNEPGDQATAANDLTLAQNNDLNARVVAAIRATGGTNASRCILVPLRYTDSYQTTGFVFPNDPNLVLTFHWYTPWTFALGNSAVYDQTWGTSDQVADVTNRFTVVANFAQSKGYPVILGEFGLGYQKNPRAQQWHWEDAVARTAGQLGVCPMLWDNGEWLNRTAHLWRDPVQPSLVVNAARGIANSWADVGDVVTVGSGDLTIPLVLNGNLLTSVAGGGRTWTVAGDYTVTGESLVLKAAALASLGSGDTSLGLTFSAGAGSFIVLRK